jgi:hypothetical protein
MHLLRKPESEEDALRPLFSFRFSQERDSRAGRHGMLRFRSGDGIWVRRTRKLLWEGLHVASLLLNFVSTGSLTVKAVPLPMSLSTWRVPLRIPPIVHRLCALPSPSNPLVRTSRKRLNLKHSGMAPCIWPIATWRYPNSSCHQRPIRSDDRHPQIHGLAFLTHEAEARIARVRKRDFLLPSRGGKCGVCVGCKQQRGWFVCPG